MANYLDIKHFTYQNIKATTYLRKNLSSDLSSIEVANSEGFSENTPVVIGFLGNEVSELNRVSSVSDGQTLQLASATQYRYNINANVTGLHGDRIVIYSAEGKQGTLPQDSEFTQVDEVGLQPDSHSTSYLDTSANDDAMWYKWTFKNSETSEETALAQAQAVHGDAMAYSDPDKVRLEAGMRRNRNIANATIIRRIIGAQDTVNAKLASAYHVPFKQPVPALVQELTSLIAAGHLLLMDYGEVNENDTKNGKAKIDQAFKIMDQLVGGEMTLHDAEGSSLVGDQRVTGHPDNRTKDRKPKDGGGDFMHRITDEY